MRDESDGGVPTPYTRITIDYSRQVGSAGAIEYICMPPAATRRHKTPPSNISTVNRLDACKRQRQRHVVEHTDAHQTRTWL